MERVQKDKTELKKDARNESRMERERLDTGRMWGGRRSDGEVNKEGKLKRK